MYICVYIYIYIYLFIYFRLMIPFIILKIGFLMFSDQATCCHIVHSFDLVYALIITRF